MSSLRQMSPLAPEAAAAPGWTRGRLWAAGGFLVWLLAQLALPAAALLRERPARFGWQMFASLRELPDVAIRRDDGTTDTVSFRAFVGNPRAEMSYDLRLVRHVCARRPDAAAVQLVYRSRTEEPVPCR